jgi:LEA14-like dessication related protein
MDKRIFTVLLLFLGFLAVRLWIKIQAVKRFSYRSLLPRNIRFEKGALKFELEMVIVNPTTDRVVVDGLDLDVFIGKTLMGKAIIFKSVVIEAGSETTLQTSVIMGVDTLLTVIPDIRFDARSVTIAFDGVVRAYGLTAPVKLSYTLTIPKFFQ